MRHPRWLDELHNADVAAFCWLQRHQKALVHFCRNISRSADGYLYALIPLLAWWLHPTVQTRHFITVVILGFAIERPLYFVLKNTCRRKRPPAAIPGYRSFILASDEFSFPSGHTCGAFLFITLACCVFGPVCSPLYLWAATVGLSRLILGVHFPGDVMMGAALGTLIGAGIAS